MPCTINSLLYHSLLRCHAHTCLPATHRDSVTRSATGWSGARAAVCCSNGEEERAGWEVPGRHQILTAGMRVEKCSYLSNQGGEGMGKPERGRSRSPSAGPAYKHPSAAAAGSVIAPRPHFTRWLSGSRASGAYLPCAAFSAAFLAAFSCSALASRSLRCSGGGGSRLDEQEGTAAGGKGEHVWQAGQHATCGACTKQWRSRDTQGRQRDHS